MAHDPIPPIGGYSLTAAAFVYGSPKLALGLMPSNAALDAVQNGTCL